MVDIRIKFEYNRVNGEGKEVTWKEITKMYQWL